MITNLELFFLLIYTAGVINVSYENYIYKKKLSRNSWFERNENNIMFFSEIIIFFSLIIAFFFIEWYLVLLNLFLGIVLSKMAYKIIKERTWVIGISLFFVSWIFLFVEI